MAERKAVNRYYPPDFDPAKHKSINKYRNSHPLRERAKKLSQGILVIRFEMPYNIWCDGCGNHVGMGVRYNAEKKKVGNYYTTPIYRFRMKCHLCDNYIEMETDPKNFDYTIVSGARRKNQKWDMAENEQVLTEDREAVKKLARDAMYKLEHGVDDTKKLKKAAPTLSQIAEVQAGKKDDYNQNQKLRMKFRSEKKHLLASEAEDRALLEKSSLDIELVPETEEDKKLASLLKYSTTDSYEEKREQKRDAIRRGDIFAASTISSPPHSEASPQSFGSKPANSKKRLTAQKTLMAKVMKSRSVGVFGAFDAKRSTSARGGSGGGSSGKTAKFLIGGTKGVVLTKRKYSKIDVEDLGYHGDMKNTNSPGKRLKNGNNNSWKDTEEEGNAATETRPNISVPCTAPPLLQGGTSGNTPRDGSTLSNAGGNDAVICPESDTTSPIGDQLCSRSERIMGKHAGNSKVGQRSLSLVSTYSSSSASEDDDT